MRGPQEVGEEGERRWKGVGPPGAGELACWPAGSLGWAFLQRGQGLGPSGVKVPVCQLWSGRAGALTRPCPASVSPPVFPPSPQPYPGAPPGSRLRPLWQPRLHSQPLWHKLGHLCPLACARSAAVLPRADLPTDTRPSPGQVCPQSREQAQSRGCRCGRGWHPAGPGRHGLHGEL